MAHKYSIDTRKKPRQARSQASFDMILEAAAQMFVAHGYVGATTGKIADRAGVSIGTLYQYFPNKGSLLAALARNQKDAEWSKFADLLSDAAEVQPPLKSVIKLFIDTLIALRDNWTDLQRVLYTEVPLPHDFVEEKEADKVGFVLAVSEFLKVHPEAKVKNPILSAYIVMQSAECLIHRFAIYPKSGVTLQQLSDEIVQLNYLYLTDGSASYGKN